MTGFDAAFAHTVGLEGGYSDHPADRGGPTRFGITQAVARKHGYEGDMRDLPLRTAKHIYRVAYWQKMGLDRVRERSEILALELFDSGVNVGTGRAAEWLQECLNVFNREQQAYADIKVDGQIGPKTLAALDAYLVARNREGLQVLMVALNIMQGAHYLRLAMGRESQEAFVYGWILQRVINSGLREAI